MWFAVKTFLGKEEDIKDLLLKKIPLVRHAFIPLRRLKDAQGNPTRHTVPLIRGFVFANLIIPQADDVQSRSNVESVQAIWERLQRNVTERGYFFYRDKVSGKMVSIPGTHLLAGDVSTTSPDLFIPQSRISDKDMRNFALFLDEDGVMTEEASLVGESYDTLALTNHTVYVNSGPLAGTVGLLIQRNVKRRHDHFFVVRFGSDFCVLHAGIRRYELSVIREATEGEKIAKARQWHEADYLIGALQRKYGLVDYAPQVLRMTTLEVMRKRRTSMSEAIETICQVFNNEEDANRMYAFVSSIPNGTKQKTDEDIVNDLISDYPIRPFLTPSEGEEAYAEVQTLQHKDFTELIAPVSLTHLFLAGKIYPAGHYDYNAHVAIVTNDENKKEAIVSWGKFYVEYATMDDDTRNSFLEGLLRGGYENTYSLLTTGHPKDNPDSPLISLKKIAGIGGFSIGIDGEEQEVVKTLIDTIAPVAVEQWQRVKKWRKSVQQTVLIHA